jgi:hypothetical protein
MECFRFTQATNSIAFFPVYRKTFPRPKLRHPLVYHRKNVNSLLGISYSQGNAMPTTSHYKHQTLSVQLTITQTMNSVNVRHRQRILSKASSIQSKFHNVFPKDLHPQMYVCIGHPTVRFPVHFSNNYIYILLYQMALFNKVWGVTCPGHNILLDLSSC